MSTRENIQFFHRFDVEVYLEILKSEQGTKEHPTQPGSYLVDGLPFYKPAQTDKYVFVLGFNLVPLSSFLIEALANHPELVPDHVLIRWTIEQELLLDITMEQVRSKVLSSGEEK